MEAYLTPILLGLIALILLLILFALRAIVGEIRASAQTVANFIADYEELNGFDKRLKTLRDLRGDFASPFVKSDT
jgi:hypothetical protein